MIWKSLIWIAHPLFWIALALALFGTVNNRRSAKVLHDGRIEFAPSRLTLWALPVFAAYLAYSAVNSLKHSHGKPWDLVAKRVK
jgi:hypothetical protein